MNYPAHFFIGMVTGVIIGLYFKLSFLSLIIWSFVGGLAALLPDIDHPQSKGTQILNIVVMAISFFLAYNCFNDWLYIILGGLFIYMMYKLFYIIFKPRHRGITHSLAAVGVVTFISYIIFKWPYMLFIPIGYLTHLVSDGVLKLL